MAVASAAATFPLRALPERSATIVRLVGLSVLCASTLIAPSLLFVWLPIALGIPHVANDLRYLLLPLPRYQVIIAAAAITALVALKLAAAPMRYEAIVVGAWLVAAIAGARPRAIGIALLAALVIVALPLRFAALAALAHNVVALVAWIVVAKPSRRQVATTLAVIGAFVAALLIAPVGDLAPALGMSPAFLRVFIFLQGIHYAVWLAWIPAAKPARMHPVLVAAVALVTVGVIGAGFVDATWTRTTYLALASFHIYLELIVLAVMAARRK